MDKKEQKIVEKSMKGDKKSLLQLFEIEGTTVLYMCIKLMGNRQDGEDAAQEVFLKIQKNISKLQAPQAYPVWINKLIVNTCLDMKARVQRKMEAASLESYGEQIGEERREFLPTEYAEQKELRENLLAAIDLLSPNYRAVILMYYYEGLSQKEIAEVLDISENAVSHRLRRARGDIQEKIELKTDESTAATKVAFSAGVPVLTQVLKDQSKNMVNTEQIENLIFTSKANVLKNALPVSKTFAAPKIIIMSIAAISILGGISTWVISNKESQSLENTSNSIGQLQIGYNSSENATSLLQTVTAGKPAVSIKFSDAIASRTSVNPTECLITVYDSPEAEISWQIEDLESGQVMAEGSGLKIEEALKIETDQDIKQYVLCVTAKATTGEISQTNQIFTVTK